MAKFKKQILRKNIIFLRQYSSYSQYQLEKRIKIKRCNIAKYEEKNGNIVTVENLVKYSNFFGISIDDLVRRDIKKLYYEDEITLKDIE